jgi:hypothetical protein
VCVGHPITKIEYTITQRAGELMYLPPGWYHEVETTQGVKMQTACRGGDEKEIAISCVWWHTPQSLRVEAVGLWAGGQVCEAQSDYLNIPAEKKELAFVVATKHT